MTTKLQSMKMFIEVNFVFGFFHHTGNEYEKKDEVAEIIGRIWGQVNCPVLPQVGQKICIPFYLLGESFDFRDQLISCWDSPVVHSISYVMKDGTCVPVLNLANEDKHPVSSLYGHYFYTLLELNDEDSARPKQYFDNEVNCILDSQELLSKNGLTIIEMDGGLIGERSANLLTKLE